jgi:flagellin-specific chaperone FliS
LIEKNTKKTKFEANELKNIYDYIMKNYQTELSPNDYKKIREVAKLFVENG